MTVAVYAGDAQYLPLADLQGNPVEAIMLALLVVIHRVEDDDRFAGFLDLAVMGGRQLPADHEVGQLLPAGLLPLQGAHGLARAQDGDPIGDVQHLPHLMADEDDALVLTGQLLHDAEQAFHLDVRQRGGGLIQHQQLRPAIQRLEDLHALLSAHGDLGDGLVQLHVQAVPFRQLPSLTAVAGESIATCLPWKKMLPPVG